jgi:hypothetical protein
MHLAACATVPPPKTDEEAVVIEGEVSVVGSHPYDKLIVLSGREGDRWTLECGAFESEIMNLTGQRVRISGTPVVVTDTDSLMLVNSYELLPMDGVMPIIGVLELQGKALMLKELTTGEWFVIRGALQGAMTHFTGLKVWVIGSVVPESAADELILDVRGYGILGPADELAP